MDPCNTKQFVLIDIILRYDFKHLSLKTFKVLLKSLAVHLTLKLQPGKVCFYYIMQHILL